jgi:hypothetical protein
MALIVVALAILTARELAASQPRYVGPKAGEADGSAASDAAIEARVGEAMADGSRIPPSA